MKKVIITLVNLLVITLAIAQSPQMMSYQAVVRNANNALVTNKNIGMKVSIFITNGNLYYEKYSEIHSPTTNDNGLVTIAVGTGTDTTGSFVNLDWAHNMYFIRTWIDLDGGTNYTIDISNQILTVPYAFHSQTAQKVTGKRYHIGDFAQGGIIFWVDETGNHGLVCAIKDANHGSSCDWGTECYTNANARGIYSGKTNTVIIISKLNPIEGSANHAAGFCNRYTDTESNYGDWYLPSIQELELMYQNKATIDAIAIAQGEEAFKTDWYWSSTQVDYGYAYAIRFSDGNNNGMATDTEELYVRAIRAF